MWKNYILLIICGLGRLRELSRVARGLFGGFCEVAWTKVGRFVATDRGLTATKLSFMVTDPVKAQHNPSVSEHLAQTN